MKIEITHFLDDYFISSGSVSEDQFVSVGVPPGRLQAVRFTSDDGTREIIWDCRGKEYKLFSVWVGVLTSSVSRLSVTVCPKDSNSSKIIVRLNQEPKLVTSRNVTLVECSRADFVELNKSILDRLSLAVLMMKLSGKTSSVQEVILRILNDSVKCLVQT